MAFKLLNWVLVWRGVAKFFGDSLDLYHQKYMAVSIELISRGHFDERT